MTCQFCLNSIILKLCALLNRGYPVIQRLCSSAYGALQICFMIMIMNIPNIAVNLDGYHLIRKDRSSGPGGGVAAVYISSNINCCELSAENVDDFEVLWSIVRPKQLPTLFICVKLLNTSRRLINRDWMI